jgi:regulator of protease activity HflC (stomatin/prohibitin superfamily)
VESAKLMRMAADELNTKAAMQIRYLETLKQVGKSNTKVIFIPEMKNKERVNHLITQGLIS